LAEHSCELQILLATWGCQKVLVKLFSFLRHEATGNVVIDQLRLRSFQLLKEIILDEQSLLYLLLLVFTELPQQIAPD